MAFFLSSGSFFTKKNKKIIAFLNKQIDHVVMSVTHSPFSLWWGQHLYIRVFLLVLLFLLSLVLFLLLFFTNVVPQLAINKKSLLQAEATVQTGHLTTEGTANGAQATVILPHCLQTGGAECVVTVESPGNAVEARVTLVTDPTFLILKQHHGWKLVLLYWWYSDFVVLSSGKCLAYSAKTNKKDVTF